MSTYTNSSPVKPSLNSELKGRNLLNEYIVMKYSPTKEDRS